MRFRIDLKSERDGQYVVLVDGKRRGLTATVDHDGYWGAQIVGVPLIKGIWSRERLEGWLQENVDPEILAPRRAEPQLNSEI